MTARLSRTSDSRVERGGEKTIALSIYPRDASPCTSVPHFYEPTAKRMRATHRIVELMLKRVSLVYFYCSSLKRATGRNVPTRDNAEITLKNISGRVYIYTRNIAPWEIAFQRKYAPHNGRFYFPLSTSLSVPVTQISESTRNRFD